jgi:hypothetical protein
VGYACYGLLLSENRWVHRRGETISILSHEFAHRSVSVDFTVPEVFHPLLRLPRRQEWLVPIGVLRKHPLRNFDLRDEAGASVPLVERSVNGVIGYHLLLTAAEMALAVEKMDVTDDLSRHLELVATGDDDEAESVIGQMLQAAQTGDSAHQAVLGDDRCRFLLNDLSGGFLLVAQIRDVESRRILKFAFDHSLERTRAPTAFELLGWLPFNVETEVPAAARAQSYHAEVEIPEELRIKNGSAIVDEDTLAVYAADGEADRAALYAPAVPLGARPVLFLEVRAERASFPAVAAAVAWITAAILWIGTGLGDPTNSEAGPAISILLASTAVFVGAIVRSGEHRLVQARFFVPRILLALSAAGGLVAGATLAFKISSVDTIWDVCAWVALVIAAILTVTLVRAVPTTRLSK